MTTRKKPTKARTKAEPTTSALVLTRAALVAEGACAEGLAAFDAAYPSGVARAEWTREACHAALRGPLGRWLVWAWRR